MTKSKWWSAVESATELANMCDPDGTTRYVRSSNFAYVKEGVNWIPFTAPNDERPVPPVVNTSVIERLGELAHG